MTDPSAEPGVIGRGPPAGVPLPPGFPPGVDPETFRLAEVSALLKAAAYFPLRSPTRSTGVVGAAEGAVVVHLDVILHRLRLAGFPGRGVKPPAASSCIDGSAARLQTEMRPLPEDEMATADRLPPPTPLRRDRSQRVGLYRWVLTFGLGEHGVAGFGTGRTLPRSGGGDLPFAAVVEVTSGWGRFAGLAGTVVLDGTLHPGDRLTLQAVVRMMDPQGRVTTGRGVPRGRSRGGTGDTVILALLGETDPQRPVQLIAGPDGRPVGSRVAEQLRLVDLDFEIDEVRPRARLQTGPYAGDLEAILTFDPLSRASVIPVQTRRGVFRLLQGDGATAGTVEADMIEGRAFPTVAPGAPAPVFRFAGFGPVLAGSGAFHGARGMLTMNSAISVFPRTLSNLYLLRLTDRRLRRGCGSGGG